MPVSGVNARDAVVFITGPTRGIGRAIADDFVQRLKADAKAVEKETAAMAHQPD